MTAAQCRAGGRFLAEQRGGILTAAERERDEDRLRLEATTRMQNLLWFCSSASPDELKRYRAVMVRQGLLLTDEAGR